MVLSLRKAKSKGRGLLGVGQDVRDSEGIAADRDVAGKLVRVREIDCLSAAAKESERDYHRSQPHAARCRAVIAEV